MRRHPFITIVIVLVLVGAGLTALKIRDRQAQTPGMAMPPVSVVVAPVRRALFADQIEALGTARANESVAITAKVTETVRKINFSDGMFVQKGDILVELTNAAESAELAEYQAGLSEAKKQYERLVGLVARGNAAQSVLDEQIAEVETAEARINQTLARLSDRLIRAPFSGILGFRNVSPGTLVTPTTVITTLDDISIIKLDFAIPERFLTDLKPGLEVTATSVAYPGRAFSGKVTTIGSRVDPVTRAIAVRAEIPNQDNLLRPGMLMNVTLISRQTEALMVPESALVPVQNRQYVYVVDDASQARRRQVTIGRRRPGGVEIVDGLSEGEWVVVEGMLRLRPGVRVNVVERRSSAISERTGMTAPGDAG